MKSFSAIHMLAAVLALVVGLVIGGLGPRSELRRVEKKLAELEERPCQVRTGADIAKIFQGRPWEEGDARLPKADPEPEPPPEPAEEPTDGAAVEEEEGGVKVNFDFGGDKGDAEPEDVEEAMNLAREALELRHEQAMAALYEDAEPTPEQEEKLNAALGRMNDDLIGLAEELREQVELGGEPSRRDAMLYAAETLDVFLTAEDELRGVFTDDQIGNLQEESLDPMSYVDPALIDVLQDLNRSQ